MRVTVEFIGAIRAISGKSRLLIKFEDTPNVEAAVQRIVEELPILEDVLIDPQLKAPRPSVLILLNGREIGVLNRLQTKLEDGDEMVLIPSSHGG